jgi:hypothetical protein
VQCHTWACDRLAFSRPRFLSKFYSVSVWTAKMSSDVSELRESLERHNETFETLLKLVPAKYYIVNDNSDEVYCHVILSLLHEADRGYHGL